MTGQPDFKEGPRVVIHSSAWKGVHAQKSGPCRFCGTNSRVELHHLVPRSLGGDDVEDNLIPLCHEHHMAWEDRGKDWALICAGIRDTLSTPELSYVIGKKGEQFLDRYYPIGDAPCPACGRKKRAPNRAEKKERGPRKRWVLSLPADEPGAAEALDELVTQAKEKLVSLDAVASDVGPFVVLCAVLYEFNTA